MYLHSGVQKSESGLRRLDPTVYIAENILAFEGAPKCACPLVLHSNYLRVSSIQSGFIV